MRKSKRQIVLAIAILLTAQFVMAGQNLKLARALFNEGEYRQCQIEALRELGIDWHSPEARLLAAASQMRRGVAGKEQLLQLESIVNDEEVELNLRSRAAHELGRAYWSGGNLGAAYKHMSFAYLNSRDERIFLRAGCSLFLLMKEDRSLRTRSVSIYSQIRSNRDLYDWNLQKKCFPPEAKSSGLFSKPGEWVVAFYRGQVGPAIGVRCSCIPSCSEYFLQACRKHGLLGFPLQADRFFREPSIVQQQVNPIVVGGLIKYGDPVSDHDYWLK